jgi:hypothetical protein
VLPAPEVGTARADVTAQVAAKVGPGGGRTPFAIISDPPALDGVALVVIFSNPALPQTTIAVFDGSAEPSDQMTLAFAAPIDPALPGFHATMGLGIGFSFQGGSGHQCIKSQVTRIEVNAGLLTGCAGNFDDGGGQSGALITVGGLDDSTANPTPPDNPPTDDELYDLRPFLRTGDTQAVIRTENTGADDNLFLAVVDVTAPLRVTAERKPASVTLSPKTATNPVDTQHCVTATVRDESGSPLPGVTVRFSTSGATSRTGSATSTTSGQARFCYPGPAFPGSDAIAAYADVDRDGVRDGDEPADTARKDWALPVGEGRKVTGGGALTTAAGGRATFGGDAQPDPPRGALSYADRGTSTTFRSSTVTAIVSDGVRAAIFGTGVVNGVTRRFRIDVVDNGEPGRNDRYRIRFDNGYDSGDRPLDSGNIQVHRA